MNLICNKYGSRGGAYDWADLPCDILVSIFEHLVDYRVDQRRAASVCVTWRRAGSLLNFKKPSIIKLPFICTCPAFKITKCACGNSISNSELRRNSFYFFISPVLNRTQTRVWLIRAEEIGMNKWLLRPPSSSDLRVISSGLKYNFNLFDQDKILGVAALPIIHYPFPLTTRFRKVILMSDLGMFLVLYGDEGKLALLSEDSHQWSYIDTSNYEFDDIINLRDELYAIDTIGRLVMINPTTLDLIEVASPPKGIDEYDVKVMYLVCSGGLLYLVYKGFVGVNYTRLNRRQSWDSWEEPRPVHLPRWIGGYNPPEIIGEPKDVGVLKFDKQNRAWVRVENLGNKLFFITKYCTFSVTAKQLGWSEGSFICFMCKDFDNVPEFGKAPIIYKVEDNVCRKQENEHSDIKVDFGPPPKWIRPICYIRAKLKNREKAKERRAGKVSR